MRDPKTEELKRHVGQVNIASTFNIHGFFATHNSIGPRLKRFRHWMQINKKNVLVFFLLKTNSFWVRLPASLNTLTA